MPIYCTVEADKVIGNTSDIENIKEIHLCLQLLQGGHDTCLQKINQLIPSGESHDVHPRTRSMAPSSA